MGHEYTKPPIIARVFEPWEGVDEVRQEEKRGERLIRVFVFDSWTAWVRSDEVATGL